MPAREFDQQTIKLCLLASRCLLAAVSCARNVNRSSACPTAVATWSSTHLVLATDSATLQDTIFDNVRRGKKVTI